MNTFVGIFFDALKSFQSEIVSYCLNLSASSILMMLTFVTMFAIALSVKFKDQIYLMFNHMIDVKSQKNELFNWAVSNDSDSIIKSMSSQEINKINFKIFLAYASFGLFGHLPIFIIGRTFALGLILTAILIVISDFKWILLASSFYIILLLFIYPVTILSYNSGIDLFESLDPNLFLLSNINLDRPFLEVANSIFSVCAPYCMGISVITMLILIVTRIFFTCIINGTLKILALVTKDSES
jgi:hypothetical protein